MFLLLGGCMEVGSGLVVIGISNARRTSGIGRGGGGVL